MQEQAYAEGLQAVESPCKEQVYPEGLQPVERTCGGAEEKCEKDGAIERSCYRLTALCCFGCRGVGGEGVKLSLGKEGSMRGRCCFNLYLFLTILIYFNWQ